MLVNRKDVAGHQFANPGIHAFFAGDVAKGKISGQRAAIELWLHARIGEDRFDFRAEQQSVRRRKR